MEAKSYILLVLCLKRHFSSKNSKYPQRYLNSSSNLLTITLITPAQKQNLAENVGKVLWLYKCYKIFPSAYVLTETP